MGIKPTITNGSKKNRMKKEKCWWCKEKPRVEGELFCKTCGDKDKKFTGGILEVYNRGSMKKSI